MRQPTDNINMKKEIGCVTEKERDEIKTLFERRNGLNELAQILTDNNVELYNRLVWDFGDTSTRFQNWWSEMSSKYNWESAENGNWEIDFDNCKIYLVISE